MFFVSSDFISFTLVGWITGGLISIYNCSRPSWRRQRRECSISPIIPWITSTREPAPGKTPTTKRRSGSVIRCRRGIIRSIPRGRRVISITSPKAGSCCAPRRRRGSTSIVVAAPTTCRRWTWSPWRIVCRSPQRRIPRLRGKISTRVRIISWSLQWRSSIIHGPGPWAGTTWSHAREWRIP